MRGMILCLFVAIGLPLFSADVQWNCFSLVDISGFSPNTYMLGYEHNGKLYADINLHVDSSGTAVTLTGNISMDGAMGVWILAEAGDILSDGEFSNVAASFSYRTSSGTGGRPVTLNKVTSFYLGMKVEELTNEWPGDWDGNWGDPRLYSGMYDYGWIHLQIGEDGGVSLLNSAIDLDGGPMIVGGGAYSIPEPSGGLLFILGAAALGLRRRIGRGDCPRFGP